MKFSNTIVESLALTALLSSSANAADECQSIAAIACSVENFSTLCTAVTEADLGDALSSGTWTVFAPTNEAFAELGDLLDAVLADKEILTEVLLFHAVDEVISSKDLHCKETTEMVNGDDSRTVCTGGYIYQKGAGNTRRDMPQIIEADIMACNGVIHVVDEVMLPPNVSPPPPTECQTIAEIACGTEDFSTLCTAVTEAGLGEALSGGEWTVFAPTNAAFTELTDFLGESLDTILDEKALLTDILLFHAVDKILYAKDLECNKKTKMANGENSRTVCKGGDIYQKGNSNPRDDMPKIVGTDVKACNGVIHVIDEVMLPHL